MEQRTGTKEWNKGLKEKTERKVEGWGWRWDMLPNLKEIYINNIMFLYNCSYENNEYK